MQDWVTIKKQVENCQNCPLWETRTHVVFGAGNEKAKVLFIGEGPGEQEDLQGQPFVGRGGQLLDRLLQIVDLSREKNIYITNMVKCRPPQNRDPAKEEQEACIGYLRTQLQLLNPKIVVCLGRVASMRIIAPDFKVTKQHGAFLEKNGILFMGTFHPAALLRNPNNKPSALEDFQKLREKIKEICPEVYQTL